MWLCTCAATPQQPSCTLQPSVRSGGQASEPHSHMHTPAAGPAGSVMANLCYGCDAPVCMHAHAAGPAHSISKSQIGTECCPLAGPLLETCSFKKHQPGLWKLPCLVAYCGAGKRRDALDCWRHTILHTSWQKSLLVIPLHIQTEIGQIAGPQPCAAQGGLPP